jgi:hypothetical protein
VILQVGKSYPFIRVAFKKKPLSDKRDFYPTDQHMFDPEKDRLTKIEGFSLVVGGLTYENSKITHDGFKRAYQLRDGEGMQWIINFPAEDLSGIWRPFELMAIRQTSSRSICAVFGEELLTAYCRKVEQRKSMLQTDSGYKWPQFYSDLQHFVQESMQLNPEVYPYVDPISHVPMPHIPTVKLKPL